MIFAQSIQNISKSLPLLYNNLSINKDMSISNDDVALIFSLSIRNVYEKKGNLGVDC